MLDGITTHTMLPDVCHSTSQDDADDLAHDADILAREFAAELEAFRTIEDAITNGDMRYDAQGNLQDVPYDRYP